MRLKKNTNVGVYNKTKNIYNMETITIKQYDNGYFEVFQGDKSSGELAYDEMLGLISSLTKRERRIRIEETKYSNDVPYERVVLRVLENYSKMQTKLTRYRKKIKEQGELLNKLNNKHNDYEKVVAERDELLQKNKELSRQLKIYEGVRKYFNSQVSKIETDK